MPWCDFFRSCDIVLNFLHYYNINFNLKSPRKILKTKFLITVVGNWKVDIGVAAEMLMETF